MCLAYDNVQTNPQYNGNIGSIKWRSISFDQEKKYDFIYDGLNRLTGAVYADNDLYSPPINKVVKCSLNYHNFSYPPLTNYQLYCQYLI
jgi:hypothetical protein